MQRTEPKSVGDILRLALEENRMQRRLSEYSAIRLWREIVGDHIADLCAKPSVEKGVMYIGVANAALRNELNMSRSSIVRHINSALGDDIISDIRFGG